MAQKSKYLRLSPAHTDQPWDSRPDSPIRHTLQNHSRFVSRHTDFTGNAQTIAGRGCAVTHPHLPL